VDDVEVHDISAGQVTAPYGLQYDGIDDFLTTASVDFTATDKMAVVMGVRKLSDAATGIVAELSVSASSANNGSFFIAIADSPGANYSFWLRGTQGAGQRITTYTSPTTDVLTVSYDISQAGRDTEVVPRANGATPTNTGTGLSDAGTGNFGNFALYFGRRGGASLPYNGLDFGGICVNKTLSASQLSSAERWTASRTGVTI
jgi:hypothetical protein